MSSTLERVRRFSTCWMYVAMTIPSSAAMPNKAMKPTQTAVFISTPAQASAIMPPAAETGMPEKTTNAREKLRKCK